MGTETEHKEKADHNQRFLETIDPENYGDWVVTVCFYKALHLVEMLLARDGRHSDNHRARHDTLKREYQDIWRQYLPLYTQSRRARYKVRSISTETLQYVRTRLSRLESLIAAFPPKKAK
jgi:hypothetical protein